jgi:WD40 repeat protein
MSWPTLTDYQESIQDPRLCFEAPELRDAEPALDPMGLPKAISGNFACVYEMRRPEGRCAVRCFIRQVPGQQGRYNNLSKYLAQVKAECLVDFEYIARGVMVKGEWYPIVKMAWVEGSSLNIWLERNARNPQALAGFLVKFRAMMRTLRQNNVAHGDLQHGNIMVTTQDEIRLVDYDGIYCPAFGRGHAPELGHINFQHPRRTGEFFEEGLDNFSALLIHASILALIAEPELLDQYYNVDNLLLSSSDLKNPMQSALFQRLKGSKDPQAARLAALLQQCCVAPIEQVPWYEDTLVKLEKGEPLTLGQPAAAPTLSRPGMGSLPKRQPLSPAPGDPPARSVSAASRPASAPALPSESRSFVPMILAATAIILIGALIYAFFRPSKKSGDSSAGQSASPASESQTEAPPPAPNVPIPPKQTAAAASAAVKVNLRGALRGHTQAVALLAVSANNRFVASGGKDASVRVWDIQSGAQKHTLRPNNEGVESIVFFNDNKAFATVGSDFSVKTWDIESGAPKGFLTNYQNNPWPVAVSPDGTTLAAGGSNMKLIRLVNAVTGNNIIVFPENSSWVRGAQFSSDGRYLGVSCYDDNVSFWDVRSQQAVKSFPIPTNTMPGFVFSSQAGLVASAAPGRLVKIWEIKTGQSRAFSGHAGDIKCLAFNSSGKLIASGAADQSVILWEVASGKQVAQFQAHADGVNAVAFTPDNRLLVTGGGDNLVKLWELAALAGN